MTLVLGDYPIVLLLVFFRVAGILLVLPFFGISGESGWLLAGAALPITLVFCGVLPPAFYSATALLTTNGDLLFAILGEALLGAAIGAVCGIFIGAFMFGGYIAAQGTSLNMAEEMDPVTGESSGLLPQIWRMLFLITIVASDAHLIIFRIMARTFELTPVPWVGWMHGGRDLALLGATVFRTGLSLAMPIMVVSLLVSISMGLISRMAEEFNVLFLSLPFRLLSGLLTMGLSILLAKGVIRSVAYDMLSTVSRFLGW